MISGAGTIGVTATRHGLSVVDNGRSPRLFKILSGSNPYTADEVVLDESDGSRDVTGIYDVTAAEKVLYEVNGNTSVPANTIVEATPNPAGAGFYFTAPPETITSGLSFLTGNFTLNATSGTYQDVLTATTLTTAGTYLFWCQVVAIMNTDTAGDRILARLTANGQSSVGSVDFPILTTQTTGVEVRQTGGCITNGVSNGGLVMKLQACRTFSGTVTTSLIGGTAISPNYTTTIAWLKIA